MTAARTGQRRRRSDCVDGSALDMACRSPGGQRIQKKRDEVGHGRAAAEGVQATGAEEVRGSSLRVRVGDVRLLPRRGL